MSPVSTALPPPQLSEEDSYFFPAMPINAAPAANCLYVDEMRARVQTDPDLFTFSGLGNLGGVGTTSLVARGPASLFCCEITTTVNGFGIGFLPGFSHPSWGPAADWASGARTAPANVVVTYSVDFAVAANLDDFPIDSAGFCFIPNTGNFGPAIRVGSVPTSGFGLFFNPNGSGAIRVEHVSWLQAATVRRVPISADVIPDVTKWNSLTYTIVTASAGRECLVSLTVNGSAIVTDAVMGVDIPFPQAQASTALEYMFGTVQRFAGGASFFVMNYGYDGRFKPDGTEMQGFG